MSDRQRAWEQAARMVLAGRIGRACRILSRSLHGQVLVRQSRAEQIKWANAVLGKGK